MLLSRVKKGDKIHNDINNIVIVIDKCDTSINKITYKIADLKYAKQARTKKIYDLENQLSELRHMIHTDNKHLDNMQSEIVNIKKHLVKHITNKQHMEYKLAWNTRMLHTENKIASDTIKISSTQPNVKFIQQLPDDIIRYIYEYIDYNTRSILLSHKYKLYKIMAMKPITRYRMILTKILNTGLCEYCLICCNICTNCIIHKPCICNKCLLCTACTQCSLRRTSNNYNTIMKKSKRDTINIFRSGGFTSTPEQQYNAIKRAIIIF
jgi:hypothetical protein